MITSYPRLVLAAGRERAAANRHPWIYSGALKKIPRGLKDGDLVELVDLQEKRLGYGHYNEGASIACRMFEFTSEQKVIDDAFWISRLDRALAYRQSLGFLDQPQAGYRLIYSEGDGIPGLVCDIFGDTASMQIKTTGMLALRPLIADYLTTKLKLKHVYHKSETAESSSWLVGNNPEATFEEAGLRFQLNLEAGQKTGYFLDQRDNRKLVGSFAKGKRVLDAFSYSGGFSVFALAGHAAHVTSVDISEDANAICKKTIQANFGDTNKHEAVTEDCFEYLRGMPENQFDLIVLDPPAFSKNASTVDRAAKGYKDINLRALQKITEGGLLFTFSCSQHISTDLFRKIIFGAAKDAKRPVRIVHQLTQAPDHPVDICHPEGEYLKGLVLYVGR